MHSEFRRRLVDSTDQVKNLLHLQVSAVQGQSAARLHVVGVRRLRPIGGPVNDCLSFMVMVGNSVYVSIAYFGGVLLLGYFITFLQRLVFYY